MLEFFIFGFTALVNILLGLTVFLKNPKGLVNRLFLFLTSTFVIWSLVNYISVHPIFFSQLTWIRLVLFCGGILNLAVFLTFLAFPNYSFKQNYKRVVRIAVAATIIIVPLTLTPIVFKGIQFVDGEPQPVPNPGIGLFLLHTLILLGSSFIVLLRKFLASKGKQRDQFRIILLAIIGTLGLIVTTNFLLVVLFNITFFVPFGPAFTLIFSSAMAYAIVKHKLFDIRLIIARAVGYALTLGTFIGFYILTLYLSTQKVFETASPFIKNQLVPLIAALILVISYPRFKNFFDRLTNKIFYQDAYDPQVFLDELNKAIVQNIELGILLRRTTAVIEKNIKPIHCFIDVLATETQARRVIGVGNLTFKGDQYEFVFDKLAELDQNIISTDDLDFENGKLKQILSENNVGVTVRLVPDKSNNEAIAHLILGAKKSGNVYTKQDMRIISIIADELLISIQNSLRFEEIQGFAVTLQQKVNEATAKLKKTNEKLKALDQTKDEFISMASHQLRTPLTSVKGYMSMVLEGDAGELKPQQKELLNQAFVSSQQMVYLIADLLNVSRLKSGKFVIDAHPVNLADIVEAEVSQLKETAKVKGLQLVFNKPKKFPDLMIDETKTRQVIMNFADNAIYYSRQGGKIDIDLREDSRNIYFTVKDNGLGVPQEEKAKLFSKFYRASNARKARPDGTGLGLFMAKKVVDAQGGNIIFESEENKGSTFGFTFNKKKLALKS